MTWPEVPIGQLCELVNGRAFKPSDWTGDGLPIVRIQNLNDHGAPFNRFNGEVRDRFLIDSGELLFSWSGTPGTSFGAFFWRRGRAVLNQHIFRVLVREGVDANYFRYAINARIDRIIDQAHGGVGLQHITKDKLEATPLPLPPLLEQRRIADILDKADAVRRKRKETIALSEELLRSAFLEMFGDPVTNPKGWPVKALGEMSKVTDGTHKTPVYVESGVPFLSAKNVRAHIIDWTNTRFITPAEHAELIRRCRPRLGDVLLTKSGTIGEAACVDRDIEFSLFESVALLTVDRSALDPQFVAALLNDERVRRLYGANVKGVGVKHLHLVDIRRLPVIAPPLADQARFLGAGQSLRSMQSRMEDATSETQCLFDALVQGAFRGELTARKGKTQLGLFSDGARDV